MEEKKPLSIVLKKDKYDWLKKESIKTGLAMSNIIKLLLNKEINKEADECKK